MRTPWMHTGSRIRMGDRECMLHACFNPPPVCSSSPDCTSPHLSSSSSLGHSQIRLRVHPSQHIVSMKGAPPTHAPTDLHAVLPNTHELDVSDNTTLKSLEGLGKYADTASLLICINQPLNIRCTS